MTTASSVDPSLASKLPKVSGTPSFPTDAQTTAQKNTLTQTWASTVG
jgi:putative spermidine/putrescine transport system substrate-binding protein